MADEGPTTVGSINAKVDLTLNGDQFEAKIKEAAAQADAMDGRTIRTKLDVEGGNGGGTAQLATDLEKVVQAEGKAKTTSEALAKARQAMEVADNRWRIAQLDLEKVEKDANATEQQRLRARNQLIQTSAAAEKAETALAAAVKAHEAALTDDTGKTDLNTKSKKDNAKASGSQFSAMQAVIGASPLLIGATDSLAAATVGLGVGFAAMGAAGILAIVGIKNAMAAGTPVGQQYSAGLGVLKGDLDQLSSTAAVAMLGSFNSSVAAINGSMPTLNLLVSEGANYLGQIGGSILTAVVTGLQAMEPLIRTGAADLSDFVGWLAHFAQEQGFQDFVSYAVANLPSVMTLLENLVTTAGHILAAFAPLGPEVIGVLNGVTTVLNAFPLPVLAGMVTLFTAVGPAINLTKGAVQLLGPAFQIAGVEATVFGLSLDAAIPIIGWVAAGITGLVALFGSMAGAQQQATANAQDYAGALQQDSDAIGQATAAQIVQKAFSDNMIGTFNDLGIKQQDLIGYAKGQADATQKVNDALSAANESANDYTQGTYDGASGTMVLSTSQLQMQKEVASATNWINQQKSAIESKIAADKNSAAASRDNASANSNAAGALRALSTQYGLTTQEIQAAAKANNDASDASGMQAAAWSALAAKYNTSVPSIMAVVGAQQQTSGALVATTLKMQEENDAAGLLKQSLDILNGSHLSLEQAQTSAAKATNTVTQSFKNNGLAIDGTTDAALANQTALQQKAQADQQAAEAVAKSTGSTEQGTAAYAKSKDQLEANLKSQGLLTDKVQAYIDKLYDVGDVKVPPTQLEVDTAQADAAVARLQAEIQAVHDRTVHMTVVNDTINDTSTSTTGLNVGNNGAAQAHALGGWISYFADGGMAAPWARGTDKVLASLTPGEFTLNRASSQAIERDHPGALGYMNATGQLPPQQHAPVVVRPVVQVYLDGRDITANMVTKIKEEISSAVRDASAMRVGI